MIMTRAIAFASMTAVFGGVVPGAALAAVMPPLNAPKPAVSAELPPPLPSSVAPSANWYVVIDGQPVEPRLSRSIELMSYLASHHGTCRKATALIDLFLREGLAEDPDGRLRQGLDRFR